MHDISNTHGGGAPESYNIKTTPVKVADADENRKFWACTNASNEPIYLALHTTATLGKGTYLAANGGAFEINNINMYYGEIWAIHGGAGLKVLCVQPGK